MKTWTVLGGFTVIATISGSANADPASGTRALEVSGSFGASRTLAPTTDARSTSSFAGGPNIQAALTYRSSYFLAPYIESSFGTIYSESTSVPIDNQSTIFARTSSRLVGWTTIVGPSWDSKWLRLRVGVGVQELHLSSVVASKGAPTATIRSHAFDMAYAAGVTGFFLVRPRARIGVDARLVFNLDSKVTQLTVGPVFAFDLLSR